MRPDRQLAMRSALAHGPAHCPADLFEGSIDRVLLGLKAHANTIAHARHIALEETYPRTRDLIGAERFHSLANDHLERNHVVSLPIAELGRGFAALLHGEADDLARLELAWLESHGAPDEPVLVLSIIANLTPEELIAAHVMRHSAARLVEITSIFEFDGAILEPPYVLVTRPFSDVAVGHATRSATDLLHRLSEPVRLGELLEHDTAATSQLVIAGALALVAETISCSFVR